MEAARSRHRFCYIHVPKCGGTSLALALRRAQPWRVRLQPDRIVAINATASVQAARRLGCDALTFRWHLMNYHLSHGATRLVYGHVPCPPQTLDWFGDTTHFITVLRDPVERWMSQYLYDRHKPEGHYRLEMSAEEFLESPAGQAHGRLYAEYFSARTPQLVPDAVSQAKATLGRFSIVALSEDLARFARAYRRLTGKTLGIGRERVNPASAERRREVEALRPRIEQACAMDLEIYAHAQRLAAA